jgi:hypothetical protein
MKKILVASFFLSLILLMSCGTSQRVTSVWTNPGRSSTQRYTSVFILAITQDRGARTIVETDLAGVAAARGLRATRSVEVFPISLKNDTAPTKEELMAKIQVLGCDAIFTVSLINVKSEQRYVPGANTYAPYAHYSYYGGFGGYYGYMQPVVYTPGYYTTDKTYFLEGNLFDTATGEIQLSMQSTACNPSDLEGFSKGYAQLLVDELQRLEKK